MKFIGIDLAWTYKNETGICVIDDSGAVQYLNSDIFSNLDILGIIKDHSDEGICIAIDAPLVVNNETGSRDAERELMRSRIHGHRLFAFNSNRTFLTNTYGEIRGETLMRLIQSTFPQIQIGINHAGSSIIETFPTGICCGLFPEIYPVKYKRKPKVSFEETCRQMNLLLGRLRDIETVEGCINGLIARIDIDALTLTRKMHKHLEDKIDAFLCAYGMYSIHKGFAEVRMFGNLGHGFILVPVSEEKRHVI